MTQKNKDSIQSQKGSFHQPRGWFYPTLFCVAFFGIIGALLVPLLLLHPQPEDGSIAALRQFILLITGFVLVGLAIVENYHSYNSSRDKNEHYSTHTRQVSPGRRTLYTTAVEQINDTSHSIRLGGIYTLIGLVDECLADSSISLKAQKKEAQIFINDICEYIRSLPSGYTSNNLKNNHPPTEAKIRTTIFEEINMRMKEKGTNPWKDFIYDFSGAIFFYPVDFSDWSASKNLILQDTTFLGKNIGPSSFTSPSPKKNKKKYELHINSSGLLQSDSRDNSGKRHAKMTHVVTNKKLDIKTEDHSITIYELPETDKKDPESPRQKSPGVTYHAHNQ